MEYRTLGRTGVRVSTYALGTMMFGADGNPDEKECIDIVHAALDAGINLIDTADTYSHGQSEEFVGKEGRGSPRLDHQVSRQATANEHGRAVEASHRSAVQFAQQIRDVRGDEIDQWW